MGDEVFKQLQTPSGFVDGCGPCGACGLAVASVDIYGGVGSADCRGGGLPPRAAGISAFPMLMVSWCSWLRKFIRPGGDEEWFQKL